MNVEMFVLMVILIMFSVCYRYKTALQKKALLRAILSHFFCFSVSHCLFLVSLSHTPTLSHTFTHSYSLSFIIELFHTVSIPIFLFSTKHKFRYIKDSLVFCFIIMIYD